jgi:hypothetical protein
MRRFGKTKEQAALNQEIKYKEPDDRAYDGHRLRGFPFFGLDPELDDIPYGILAMKDITVEERQRLLERYFEGKRKQREKLQEMFGQIQPALKGTTGRAVIIGTMGDDEKVKAGYELFLGAPGTGKSELSRYFLPAYPMQLEMSDEDKDERIRRVQAWVDEVRKNPITDEEINQYPNAESKEDPGDDQ